MSVATQGSAIGSIAGEEVVLLPAKALYWPRERTLFVADVHLGKAATFRAHSVPIPTGATLDTLDRLTATLRETNAERLCILGDLWHAQAGRTVGALGQFQEWRRVHDGVEVLLVDGNHDRRCEPLSASFEVRTVPSGEAIGPFRLLHEPDEFENGYALAGHIHPGARLKGRADAIVLPCFWFGARCGVLPAFGSFTGYRPVKPSSSDGVFVIADGRVIQVSGS